MAEETPTPPETGERASPERTPPLFRGLQILALAAVAGLFVLLVLRVLDAGRGGKLVGQIRAGKKPAAPKFVLPVIWGRSETWPRDARQALDDQQVSLEELRGRPVVINFWASWCSPCKNEAPLFRAAASAHAGRVVFLGIDTNDLKSDARRFLRKYEANYVSVRDRDASTQARYGLTGLPETYYLNARGRIVAHTPGEVRRSELEQGITQASGAGS
jgi:cytochrome c biogenesis protein CcmG/thiol:disulfide interchange protein DsbE